MKICDDIERIQIRLNALSRDLKGERAVRLSADRDNVQLRRLIIWSAAINVVLLLLVLGILLYLYLA